jgi:hypothetical protein
VRVSDLSQGPGWWLAADGKWYPPTSAPGGAPAPPMPPPAPPVSFVPPEGPRRGRLRTVADGFTRRQWIVIAIGAVVIIGGIAAWTITHPTKTTYDTVGNAQEACHQFVSKQLKSPTSASFNSDTDTVTPVAAGWMVIGQVDADNSFGAKLRSPFSCRVHLSSGNWYGDNVTVGTP